MNLSSNAKDQIQVNFIDKINKKRVFIDNVNKTINKYYPTKFV